MRLIDADKITFFNCLAKTGNAVCCHAEGITSKLGIEMQPTVEAIPIEWIEMFVQKYKFYGDEEYKLFHFMITQWKKWRKENETDR